MINSPLHKILFIDIECVGISSDYDNFKKDYPSLCYQFDNYLDWFQKRFPEDLNKSKEEIFVNRAALVPEFLKVVCVSVGFVDPKGDVKKQSFFNSNEELLLREVNTLLNRVDKLGFFLCVHGLACNTRSTLTPDRIPALPWYPLASLYTGASTPTLLR